METVSQTTPQRRELPWVWVRALARDCTGCAAAFEAIQDFYGCIDDDALFVDETCAPVMKNCGAKDYPGI